MKLTNDDDTLLDRLYIQETIVLSGDMQFGPYKKVCDYTPTGASINCTVTNNYGARDIYMLSIRRVLDASVPNDYSPTTPDISYRVPNNHGVFPIGTIVGIAVGSSVALILLIMLLLWFLCRKSRDNRSAPSNVHLPVTLVFTDIESSTALWATLPQLMPRAVAMHHELIRGAIAKHKCYEVKTVGDSFMIACKDVYRAVQVACEIQELMLRNLWGTDELDVAYRDFEMRRRDESIEYKPPTAMLTRDEYGALWNGLRIRIGIHTGLSDIRHDIVTGGIDYYGETSNMAARTEAIGNGGQILLTEWAWWSLSHSERASFQCESLGPQKLRGVPCSVEVYQLNSVPGRRYAELRTELDVLLPDDDRGDMTSNDASALLSSAGTIAGPATAMAAVLTNCFSPFSVVQRVKGLQPLLQKWGIAIPQRNSRITDEDYCQALINRLAIKMSSVALMRQRLAHVDVDAKAQPHTTVRCDRGARSSGTIVSSTLTADDTKSNPLNPLNVHDHPQFEQRLQCMAWTSNDGDDVVPKANTIAYDPLRCDSDGAKGGSSGIRRLSSDSVVSINISMPLTFKRKT
ncbi:unnamed protein product [Phytomonas sp. Hart1]|nr:unnamed protein product [Phytomonas sp. Hart1]|eukprot:CCW71393.1 unnamed protein product [Phytomonas sp. isolate Hart1]